MTAYDGVRFDTTTTSTSSTDQTSTTIGCAVDYDFYDDGCGAPLDHQLASAARKTEIEFFKSRGVYTKVR